MLIREGIEAAINIHNNNDKHANRMSDNYFICDAYRTYPLSVGEGAATVRVRVCLFVFCTLLVHMWAGINNPTRVSLVAH